MTKLTSRFGFALLFLLALTIFGRNANAQTVVYTTFGPSLSFDLNRSYSVNAPAVAFPHEVATSFVSNGNYDLAKIDIALCYFHEHDIEDPAAANTGAVVQLVSDAGGQPGSALQSWTLPPLPGCGSTTTESLTPTSPVPLVNGSRYWVEVMQIGPHGFVDWSFNTQSLTGVVLASQDNATWTPDSPGTLPAFDVLGGATSAAKFEYMGVSAGQSIRLTVVAGPNTVSPGSPIQAVLGFLDANGNAVVPSRTVTLGAGQAQSFDYRPSVLNRVEILPVVTPASGSVTFPAALHASAEVFDNLLAIGTVFASGTVSYPASPTVLPQGLAGGQTIRLTVFAFPPNPCAGTLSFVDVNGNPLGTTRLVNLSGEQSGSLDLNADTVPVRLGQRIEVQPMVTLSSMPSGGPQSVCPASVEVFDHLTGRTETYQSGSAK